VSVSVDFDVREGIEFPELEFEKIQKICDVIVDGELEYANAIYISMIVTGNTEIQEINREFRGKDMPTDVISFAYRDGGFDENSPLEALGDIVISIEKIREQAIEFGHGFEREFYYLLIHGLLHLCGYDHIKEDEKVRMREREEHYFKQLVRGEK